MARGNGGLGIGHIGTKVVCDDVNGEHLRGQLDECLVLDDRKSSSYTTEW